MLTVHGIQLNHIQRVAPNFLNKGKIMTDIITTLEKQLTLTADELLSQGNGQGDVKLTFGVAEQMYRELDFIINNAESANFKLHR